MPRRFPLTKHALEAYSTSLREEMGPHGVEVSIVQPGGILADIDKKSEAGTTARLRSARPPFDEEARALIERALAANRSPALGYSREELISMLDQRLKTEGAS